MLVQATREKHFPQVRVGQSSLCSHALLLPLGVPPMVGLAYFTQNLAQNSEVGRVLTATEVGDGGTGSIVAPLLKNPPVGAGILHRQS